MDLQDKKHNVIIWVLTVVTVVGFLGYAVAKGQLHGVEMFIVFLSLAAVVGLLALADLGFFHTAPRTATDTNSGLANGESQPARTSFATTALEPTQASREVSAASPYLSSGKKRKKKRR